MFHGIVFQGCVPLVLMFDLDEDIKVTQGICICVTLLSPFLFIEEVFKMFKFSFCKLLGHCVVTPVECLHLSHHRFHLRDSLALTFSEH